MSRYFVKDGWVHRCIEEPEQSGGACLKCVYEEEVLHKKVRSWAIVWPTEVFDTYRAAVERCIAWHKEGAWYWERRLDEIHEADDLLHEASMANALASAGYKEPATQEEENRG